MKKLMIKIFALLSLLLLVVGLCACNSTDVWTNVEDDTFYEEENIIQKFEKPETYATILNIKMNAEFNLYLDEDNNVIAIEPINKPSQGFSLSIPKRTHLQTVLEAMVTAVEKSGVALKKGSVKFCILESKSEKFNQESFLKEVQKWADDTAEKTTGSQNVTVTSGGNTSKVIGNDGNTVFESSSKIPIIILPGDSTSSNKPTVTTTSSKKPTVATSSKKPTPSNSSTSSTSSLEEPATSSESPETTTSKKPSPIIPSDPSWTYPIIP